METTSESLLRLEQVSLYASLKSKQLGYPILQDISFEVFEGDRIAIVGPMGAGKTSLLRLINRLSDPSKGKIFWKNQEYHQIPIWQLRSQVTLVLQEPRLLGMTVQEAIAYPLILRGLPQQVIEMRVNHWMEQLQIPREWLGRAEVQLSLGQRQLVAIARGLAIQPKILLLDEPTSALDAGRAEHLMGILSQLELGSHPSAILMVNHQLELVQRFCTRLLSLQQGGLLANQAASDVGWDDLQERLQQVETEKDFEF